MTTRGGSAAGRRSGRRHGLRVLPTLAVLLAAGGIATAVSPDLRQQLTESVTRQDAGYLEIFFVDEQRARACPVDGDGRVQVDVAVRSHYDDARTLDWTVTVTPDGGTVRAQRGRVELPARGDAEFTTRVPVPSPSATGGTPPPYTVAVVLAGYRERLLLHC